MLINDAQIIADFNTKKVRLKRESGTDHLGTDTIFQYQKGAIKTELTLAYLRSGRPLFQYQKGAIKTASSRASLARTEFQYQKGAIKT